LPLSCFQSATSHLSPKLHRNFDVHSVPRIVQCQLVERASAVVVTGAAAVAADEMQRQDTYPRGRCNASLMCRRHIVDQLGVLLSLKLSADLALLCGGGRIAQHAQGGPQYKVCLRETRIYFSSLLQRL
jgi:hypothetical protein